ncbi:Kelch repeat-containing protein [Aquiflexum lacus]|uniref:hypothetical protein n=1 Tax=Aquiflexum lacus TaxID=2483805 RepID=UPI00189584DD|nr:hypothetical protein [Aquiflexum lacus]
MKIQSKIVLFCLIIGLFACEKDTLEPRKNPRFSIAFVQNLDASGAQFAANVFEFGNEEILEYGFVYGKSFQPRIENSEIVKKEGKPAAQFEIKATHSMALGEKYNVAAFMRTATGYIYSAPVEFESKGSEGFIFQRIELPTPLYFRDTITVFASNLSRSIDNYTVIVESEIATVVEIGDDYFKFLLPDGILFDGRIVMDKTFLFYLKIGDKLLQVESPFTFKKPEFRIIPNQKVNYNQPVFIEGDFMESAGFFEVYYVENQERKTQLNGNFNSKTRIGFNPSTFFSQSSPKIEVVIRGEPYLIENSFEINPTEFVTGQQFSVNSADFIVAKVINKNIHNLWYNSIIASDFQSPVELTGEELLEDDEVGFVINMTDGVKRNNRFYFNNFGKLSENFIEVNLTNPSLFHTRIPERFYNVATANGSRAVSMENKGYFFAGKEVFKLTPEIQGFTLVTQSQSNSVFSLSNQFALLAPNGKIYTGADNLTKDGGLVDFFEFDPLTERIVKLPNIPTRSTSPLAVYATDKYLYYDGGFVFTEGEGAFPSNERWRFDFASQTWSKINDAEFEMGTNRRSHLTYRHNAKLFMIGLDNESDNSTFLYEFNETIQKWNEVGALDLPGLPVSNEVFVIGMEAFALFERGLFSFNLVNYQVTEYSSANYLRPLLSVGITNRIYIYDGYYIIAEVDPEFF